LRVGWICLGHGKRHYMIVDGSATSK
jgi:hypothetical protein